MPQNVFLNQMSPWRTIWTIFTRVQSHPRKYLNWRTYLERLVWVPSLLEGLDFEPTDDSCPPRSSRPSESTTLWQLRQRNLLLIRTGNDADKFKQNWDFESAPQMLGPISVRFVIHLAANVKTGLSFEWPRRCDLSKRSSGGVRNSRWRSGPGLVSVRTDRNVRPQPESLDLDSETDQSYFKNRSSYSKVFGWKVDFFPSWSKRENWNRN